MTAADRLKSISLLASFTDEDREALAELLDERVVREGRRIFTEGTEAEGMILVLSGSVRVESRRTGGSEVVDAPLALGALSLMTVGPRECTAFAHTECEVLLFPRTSFRRLADDHPRTACRLAECLVDEAAGLIRSGLDKLADA